MIGIRQLFFMWLQHLLSSKWHWYLWKFGAYWNLFYINSERNFDNSRIIINLEQNFEKT